MDCSFSSVEPRHRGGRAAVWIVLVLVVIGIVAALFLIGTEFAPAPAEPREPDLTEAAAELDALQQRFSGAIQRRRSIEPMLDDARELVDRYPAFAPARVSLGQMLIASGKSEAAYEQLVAALDLDPNQAELEDLAGGVALGLDRPEEAQRHYEQAVSLEQDNPRYRLHLAVALLRQNRYDKARNTLLEALRLDASLHEAHAMLADVFAAQNKLGPAMDQLNRALELASEGQAKHREAYLRKLATLLRRDNRAAESLDVLRRLPPRRWIDRQVSEEMAQSWMMLGRPGDAAHHYEQVLFVAPGTDWAAERAAYYRLKAGQTEEARENLKILKQINPRAPQITELEAALR